MENKSRQIKKFWEVDESDFHANIGTIRRAITIVPYLEHNGQYGISPRSYFPFTNEQYSKRFDNIYDATIYAENILLAFVQSIFEMTGETQPQNLINNQKIEIEQ